MYTNLIATVEKELDVRKQLLEELQQLPALELIRTQSTYLAGDIILCMPYDLDAMYRNRDTLVAAGWTWDKQDYIRPFCGEILTDFFKGPLTIHLHVDPDYEGSTCKKKVLGYEDRAIYEVVCAEA